ncbi:MAG: DNA-directed RNA polymerase subunit alpha [Parachlamydiales bacterium]|jgi:DNA-directed RNA polymerase subunit alpha
MAIKYGKFEMPEKIKIEEIKTDKNYARFVAEPFERGFGHTLGNALRRVMLTALEAPALVSVRLEGVPHEYTAIEGVLEDMTYIVLNLKTAKLRYLPTDQVEYSRSTVEFSHTLEIPASQIEKAGGAYKVTLKEFIGKSQFELQNPDLHILTVTKPFRKKIDFRVGFGRGYVPSERIQVQNKKNDEIVLDVAYSPVTLVNYFVEDTRVGQDTDYDRLVLEVTTDGRITPQEALSFATQITLQHFQIFDYLKNYAITFEQEKEETNKDREELLNKLALKISEIELSVRSTNCLMGANIETIGELVVMPESEMLKFRNFGKKSLTEIKSKLSEMGLSLGMDLSKFNISVDNVKTIIKQFLEEKVGKDA